MCALTVGGTLLVATLGGYAFGRFSFPGKNALFLLTLAILMVPYATILIALYVLLGWIGLQDFAARAEPGAHHVPAAVLDLHDAQRVRGDPEGAGGVRADRRLHQLRRADSHHAARGATGPDHRRAVRVPHLVERVLRPADPAQLDAQFTVMLAVVNMRTASFGAIDYAALEAGVTFMAVPCLLLFLVLQRSYVRYRWERSRAGTTILRSPPRTRVRSRMESETSVRTGTITRRRRRSRSRPPPCSRRVSPSPRPDRLPAGAANPIVTSIYPQIQHRYVIFVDAHVCLCRVATKPSASQNSFVMRQVAGPLLDQRQHVTNSGTKLS